MEEAAAIEQAFHVMTIVPNQANDMMDIGRLQGFEVMSKRHFPPKRFSIKHIPYDRVRLWLMC